MLGTRPPVRVLAVDGVPGVSFLSFAPRHGSWRHALAALAVATVTLPLGTWKGRLQSGRICYLLMILSAVG